MANCEKCGKTMYANQAKCSCGWKRITETKLFTPGFCEFPGCANPGTLSHNTFGEGGWLCVFHYWKDSKTRGQVNKLISICRKNLNGINEYVTGYRSSHPRSTKREACLAWLKENNLLTMLPENMREADEERRAIQQE